MTGTARTGTRSIQLRRPRRLPAWLRELIRIVTNYSERNGDHYAAAITFFTLLSIVPLLMISASVLGFVLASDPRLVSEVYAEIAQSAPKSLRATIQTVLAAVIDERGKFGVAGLLFAAYSGWSWIRNLRDAATAMWNQPPPQHSVLRNVLADAAILLGLGMALLLSVALTSLGGVLGDLLLDLTGLAGTGWARVVLSVLAPVLAIAVNGTVLLWVLTKLPRQPAPLRSGLPGAAVCAVGFEVLKYAGNFYLKLIQHSPAVATLGALVGLLIFIYLVARLFLLVTVWTAMLNENARTVFTAPVRPSKNRRNGRHPAGVFAAGASATAFAHRTLTGGR